jgi:hypothetical protein
MITEDNFDMKSEKVVTRLGMRSVGGGMFILGLYLWSPAWLRGTWMRITV